VSSNTFNVAPIKGWVVDDTTNPLSPQIYYISYSGGTHTDTYVNTSVSTWVYLTNSGVISQLDRPLTEQERRQNIFLGKISHPNKTNIVNTFSQPDYVLSPLSQLRDMFTPINLINGGIRVSANGANLNINTSSGYLYGLGINFSNDTLNPNAISVSGTSPCTFQYRTQTGGTTTNVTSIDPLNYDNGGIVTPLTGTKATNQRIYLLQNGDVRVQYGQVAYTSLALAVAGIATEQFIEFSNHTTNGILIGILSVLSTTTDLSDTTKALFFNVSKFGDSSGAAGGTPTTTLQQAYNNSINPEIVTNSTLNGVQFKGGTGNDNDKNIIIETNAGVQTAWITASGDSKFNSVSATTFYGNGQYLTGIPNVTGFSYNNQNKLTISQDDGKEDLFVYLNEFSGLTVNGNASINGSSLPNGYALSVTGDTNFIGDVYVQGDLTYQGNLLVTGSTTIQNGLTANTIYTDYIDFNTNFTGSTTQQGRVSWDKGTGTLNITVGDTGTGLIDLQVGQEEIVRVYNSELTDLLKGEVVYVVGHQGNRPSVKRALATSDGYSVTTLGMVDSTIGAGTEGYVTTFGIISNLNTNGLTGGTPIFLSPTVAGGYTSVKPQAPNHIVLLGYVVRPNSTNAGSIFINISNGWELDELHDVRISGATTGDLLMRSTYNGSNLWVNTKNLIGDYTISNSLSATTFCGSGIGLNNIPISGVTNLQTSLDLKTDLSLFNLHTGNTNNPHQTSFYQLISTAHTHSISDINDLTNQLSYKFDKSGGTVNGNVIINGNVEILGTATTINTQTLSVADNVVTLNSNYTGGTPFFGHSGIEVLRGSGTTAAMLWEEQNLQWEAGLHGSTKRVILQGDSLSLLTSGHTHPISEINNLQNNLDDKLSKFSGGTVTGSTNFIGGLSAITTSDGDLIIPFKSIGVYETDTPSINNQVIAGYFESVSGTNRYSLQLKDGTEGLNKVLVSKTSDGKANWSSNFGVSTITATTFYGSGAYLTDIFASGSFSSSTYSTSIPNTQVVFSRNGTLSGSTNLTWVDPTLTINGNLIVNQNTNLKSLTATTTLVNGSLTVTGTTLLNTLTATTPVFYGQTIVNGNLTVTGSTSLQSLTSTAISGNVLTIVNQPTSGITSTQILMRNSTTGLVEITDSTSPAIYNYGMSYAMSNFTYLT